MHAGTAAAAAAGATGAGGIGLFSYNKANFGFDAGMRFGRFMMARGFANAQVGQYREDIAGITGATVSKMDAWQTVTTLFLAVGAALSCAGRIGMHGCAPPGWYCALFSGTIFMSVMFNGTSLWLSMHASLRAQCAATSLLTRKVRLPIPSMGQLDQARVFGSSYEKQEMRDIFRVPFMRHPHDVPDVPVAEMDREELKKMSRKERAMKAAHDPNVEFSSTARDTVPSWIRDEAVVDKGEGFPETNAEPIHDYGEAPDHFKLLMEAQEEWRDYDVYARISMLYGVVSFLYAVTYYAVGTAIAELRGFWVMWSLPMVFMTAQALILRLDILRTGKHRLPNAEYLGHLAPYIAVAACTLEYRFFYSEAQVAITWGLVMLCFFAHFVMALRMLDLAWPDGAKPDMPEEPGRQWWPGSWKLPSAFTKNLWFITPPKKLEPGQSCLMHEMEDMRLHGGGISACRRRRGPAPKPQSAADEPQDDDAGAYTGASPFKDFGIKRASDLPWQLVRVAIVTAATQWFFMMVVTSVEVILGPESLLKPPGEPPWIRDMKYRDWTPAKVHLSSNMELPSDYKLFSASNAHYSADGGHGGHGGHGDHGHEESVHEEGHNDTGGQHRRLTGELAAIDELLKALPKLSELADKIGKEAPWQDLPGQIEQALPAVAGNFMAPTPEVKRVQWPAMFEPRHLLCGREHSKVVALTPRGFGALVDLHHDHQGDQQAEPFALAGLAQHGPIAGASWATQGLQLITESGKFLHCAGQAPAAGAWPCAEASRPPLPLPKGAQLLSAAIATSPDEAKDASPLVAVISKHLPQMAVLYRPTDDVWHPVGQVHIPPGSGRPSLSFDADELLVSTSSGEVHRRPLAAPATAHPAPLGTGASHEFSGACAARDGGLLRLALKQAPNANFWGPELLASA